MRNYVIKRLAATIPLLLGITFLCFGFISLIPSDPAEVALRVRQTPIVTEEAIRTVRAELGLDAPFFVRYLRWLASSLRLDFGVSYTNPSRTVLSEIGRCMPATLRLAGLSIIFVVALSLPIGFLSAVYKDSFFDRSVRVLVFAATSMPPYWVGLLLIWIFSLKMNLFPTSGSGGWRHMVLPALTVSLTYVSTYIRLIRNNMLDNMKQDYVLYAGARGLKRRVILTRHILKNSLQSCVTAIGMSIPQLISGTIVVENVFAWPGVGKLCVTSIFNRDYPVIQVYVLMTGVLFVFFNLIFDIVQHASDPRLRMGGE
jgi:nickel transport system permease protein